MALWSTFTSALKRYFVSGVLVVVPLILTWIVLKFLFQAVDGVLQPILHRVFGYWVTGLGVVTTVLLIILAGILTRNLIGAKIYRVGERILTQVPIIRPVYSSAKQLMEAVTKPGMKSFQAVVLIEYPRRGAYAIALLSKRVMIETDGGPEKYVSVFVPSTPTPVSGFTLLIPEEEAIVMDMTVEEGVKFLVSGGVTSPELMAAKKEAERARLIEKGETVS